MRVSVLFIMTLAALSVCGEAVGQILVAPTATPKQLTLRVDPEDRYSVRPREQVAHPLFLDHVFVEDSLRDRVSDRRLDFGVPIANTQFRVRTDSYYLKDGMKQRTEGFYAVREVDERTIVFAGIWLTKYSQDFFPRNEKEPNVGIGFTKKFSYKPKYRF